MVAHDPRAQQCIRGATHSKELGQQPMKSNHHIRYITISRTYSVSPRLPQAVAKHLSVMVQPLHTTAAQAAEPTQHTRNHCTGKPDPSSLHTPPAPAVAGLTGDHRCSANPTLSIKYSHYNDGHSRPHQVQLYEMRGHDALHPPETTILQLLAAVRLRQWQLPCTGLLLPAAPHRTQQGLPAPPCTSILTKWILPSTHVCRLLASTLGLAHPAAISAATLVPGSRRVISDAQHALVPLGPGQLPGSGHQGLCRRGGQGRGVALPAAGRLERLLRRVSGAWLCCRRAQRCRPSHLHDLQAQGTGLLSRLESGGQVHWDASHRSVWHVPARPPVAALMLSLAARPPGQACQQQACMPASRMSAASMSAAGQQASLEPTLASSAWRLRLLSVFCLS